MKYILLLVLSVIYGVCSAYTERKERETELQILNEQINRERREIERRRKQMRAEYKSKLHSVKFVGHRIKQ